MEAPPLCTLQPVLSALSVPFSLFLTFPQSHLHFALCSPSLLFLCVPSVSPSLLSLCVFFCFYEVNHSLVVVGLFPILYIPPASPWVAVGRHQERSTRPALLFLACCQTLNTRTRAGRETHGFTYTLYCCLLFSKVTSGFYHT